MFPLLTQDIIANVNTGHNGEYNSGNYIYEMTTHRHKPDLPLTIERLSGKSPTYKCFFDVIMFFLERGCGTVQCLEAEVISVRYLNHQIESGQMPLILLKSKNNFNYART